MTPSLGEISLNGSGYTETNYKKMTTTILKNGTKYKYQVLLNWKLLPATRSYDIIGIGHYKSDDHSYGGIFRNTGNYKLEIKNSKWSIYTYFTSGTWQYSI